MKLIKTYLQATLTDLIVKLKAQKLRLALALTFFVTFLNFALVPIQAQTIDVALNADNGAAVVLSIGNTHTHVPYTSSGSSWASVRRATITLPPNTDLNQCKITTIAYGSGGWNGFAGVFRGNLGASYTGGSSNIVSGISSIPKTQPWLPNMNAIISSAQGNGMASPYVLGNGSVTSGTSIYFVMGTSGVAVSTVAPGVASSMAWGPVTQYSAADLAVVTQADFDWVWPAANTQTLNWVVFQVPCGDLVSPPPPPPVDHLQCHGLDNQPQLQNINATLHSPLYSGATNLGIAGMICNSTRTNYGGISHPAPSVSQSWVCYDTGTSSLNLPSEALSFVSPISGSITQALTTEYAAAVCLPSLLYYSGSPNGATPPNTPTQVQGDAKLCHPTTNIPTDTTMELLDIFGGGGETTDNTHHACLPAKVDLTLGTNSTVSSSAPSDLTDSWSCYDINRPHRTNKGQVAYSNIAEVNTAVIGERKLICSRGTVFDGNSNPFTFTPQPNPNTGNNTSGSVLGVSNAVGVASTAIKSPEVMSPFVLKPGVKSNVPQVKPLLKTKKGPKAKNPDIDKEGTKK